MLADTRHYLYKKAESIAVGRKGARASEDGQTLQYRFKIALLAEFPYSGQDDLMTLFD